MPLISEPTLAAVAAVFGTKLVPVSLISILDVGIPSARLATFNHK